MQIFYQLYFKNIYNLLQAKIYFFFKFKHITKTFKTYKNYSKENIQNAINEHTLHLNEILNTDNVNNQVNILNNVLKKAINKCTLLITTRVINLTPKH